MSNKAEKASKATYEKYKKEIPIADPNRVVDGWNYGKNTYIYKDQRPVRQKFNNRNAGPAYPDFHVAPIQEYEVKLPEFLWIEGKKYRLRYRSNGVVELEEQ